MPESPAVKVIIDTNLWISFLIGKRLEKLRDLIVDSTIQPIFSKQSIDEIVLVTRRPKLQKYFSTQKVDELIVFLKNIGLFIDIQSVVTICRDPKDNYLLALVKDAKADFLTTGDQDLLVLKSFEGTEIITYRDFLTGLNF